MVIYDWIILNKELIKIVYALIIVIICAMIVIKTDRLFRLSLHQGIRYFRNAFLFYGLAFLIRHIVLISFAGIVNYYSITKILFEFLMIMAGFFLFYSLLWKRFEVVDSNYSSSLLNPIIILFYILAFIISILDYLWNSFIFMFFSQIVLFEIISIISYLNYSKGKEINFLKFYFIAMILSFSAWILNAIVAFYLDWNKGVLMGIYIINIIVFLLFLYGIIKVTK